MTAEEGGAEKIDHGRDSVDQSFILIDLRGPLKGAVISLGAFCFVSLHLSQSCCKLPDATYLGRGSNRNAAGCC